MKPTFAFLFILTLIQIKASAQYKEGFYYKKDGTKVTGLLRFNYGGDLFTDKSDGDCTLSFKRDREAKREKFTPEDICCFVIEKDSFSIVKNFRLNAFVTYPVDFAKVLEAGKINLYLYYSIVPQNGKYGGTTNTAKDWVIEKDGEFDKLTKKKFKKLMPLYLKDYPELISRINNGEFRYRDVEKIVRLYNERWK